MLTMNTNPQPTTPGPIDSSPIQQLSPSLTLEWKHNRQLILFDLKDMSRTTVDLWVNTLVPIMKEWPREKTFRVLYNATDPRVTLTPYLRRRLDEFSKVSGGLKGRAGLVLGESFVAQLIQGVLHTQQHPAIQSKLFFDFDEALTWITEGLDLSSG